MNDISKDNSQSVTIPRLSFNLVFICVFVLTICFGIGHFYESTHLANEKLAAYKAHENVDEKTRSLSDLTKLDSDLYGLLTLGCGSIFGLFGGRALK
jgi:hypothetical protein